MQEQKRVAALKAKIRVPDGKCYEPSSSLSAGGLSPDHTPLIGQQH
jgi:hypothetical protein